VTSKNVSKFKRRIREHTGGSWGVWMERRLSELRSYFRGWAGYFVLAAHRRRVYSDVSVVVTVLFFARTVQHKQPSVAQLKLFDKLDQCRVFSCRGRVAAFACVTGNAGATRARGVGS
jgi:hypothetical protein